MKLFNNIQGLERALDVSTLRHKLITNNIANVDTPGYKTADVSFSEVLKTEQSKFKANITNSKHVPIGKTASFQPKITVQESTSILNDQNNVDIEYEMTKLSENNLYYQTLTQTLNKQLSMLRYVVTEGRR